MAWRELFLARPFGHARLAVRVVPGVRLLLSLLLTLLLTLRCVLLHLFLRRHRALLDWIFAARWNGRSRGRSGSGLFTLRLCYCVQDHAVCKHSEPPVEIEVRSILVLAAGTGFASTSGDFVFRCPSAPLCLFVADAALFIAFFDVGNLTFLFIGVGRFIASWHDALL